MFNWLIGSVVAVILVVGFYIVILGWQIKKLLKRREPILEKEYLDQVVNLRLQLAKMSVGVVAGTIFISAIISMFWIDFDKTIEAKSINYLVSIVGQNTDEKLDILKKELNQLTGNIRTSRDELNLIRQAESDMKIRVESAMDGLINRIEANIDKKMQEEIKTKRLVIIDQDGHKVGDFFSNKYGEPYLTLNDPRGKGYVKLIKLNMGAGLLMKHVESKIEIKSLFNSSFIDLFDKTGRLVSKWRTAPDTTKFEFYSLKGNDKTTLSLLGLEKEAEVSGFHKKKGRAEIDWSKIIDSYKR